MKTFLNVLYRRILYKIPLKLLLVLLAVFAVLFACFSSADNLCSPILVGSTNIYTSTLGSLSRSQGQYYYCVLSNNGDMDVTLGGITYGLSSNEGVCVSRDEFPDGVAEFPINCNDDFSCNLGRVFFGQNCILMSSLQCQTEYNLIPINSVDQNYCTTNNLCPSVDCPGGDLTPGVSNIFINDIFHPGAFNVIMNIPEEIDWDYAYTNSGQNFNIDVVGYNVDYEKMQSVIDLQNYKPTDEDFSEIISVLAPYSKIIIFFVVLFSLWAMIKKPFKSKKL